MNKISSINNEVYLNYKKRERYNKLYAIMWIVHFIVLLTPGLIAYLTDDATWLVAYTVSVAIICGFWFSIIDDYEPFKTKYATFDRKVSKSYKVDELVDLAVELSQYEDELRMITLPDPIFQEMLDKIENYDRLSAVSNQAKEDLKAYTKNVKKLLEKCRQDRGAVLMTSSQAVAAALINAGITPEESK